MLLLQFTNEHGGRLVGLLQDDVIRVIEGYNTTYALAQDAIRKKVSLAELVNASVGNSMHSYADVAAAGRVLPPLDHADEAHCYVTGTGLTHLGSAGARDAMHKKIGGDAESLSDSMKMFRLGVEGGKPEADTAGAQPEWFYKGDGSIVRAGGQPLRMPDFALDGGEARVGGGQDFRHPFLDRLADVDDIHLRTGNHDVARTEIRYLEHAFDHRQCVGVDQLAFMRIV